MESRRVRRRWLSLGAMAGLVVAMAIATLGGTSVSAQDDTGHPAHIHKGTCDTLGDVQYPLSNVGPGVTKNGKTEKAGAAVGAKSDIYPIDASITTVNAKLSDIADGNHALNVHESAAKIQNYIACGNIGGTMVGSTLMIGLEERNNSGYTGVAILESKGDKTVVTVYLAEGLAGGAAPAEASPTTSAGTSGTATTAAVTISGFAFDPPSLEIAAGTTVTWTNQDNPTHTVTADDGSFNSGNLATGQTFSHTFAKAGSYTYHCAIHSSMKATIVVK